MVTTVKFGAGPLGFKVHTSGGNLIVNHVASGSQASRGGVKLGMHVVSAGGAPLAVNEISDDKKLAAFVSSSARPLALSFSAVKGATLPGKLGNPNLQLKDDPRIDPRLLATMTAVNFHVDPAKPPINTESSDAEVQAFCAAAEPGFQGLGAAAHEKPRPTPCAVTSTEKVIKGKDGNDIKLYIHAPAGNTKPLPCVVHTHGGGMAILTAADANYVEWRRHLAAQGLVVVGVEFRNAAGALGSFAFPAGLSDCFSALEYVNKNKAELNVGKTVVMSGESGGGNLSLATCMKAKKEGKLSYCQGVYAQCPYIAGPKAYAERSTTSMHENNGYFLDVDMMAPFARIYAGMKEDSLAWPSFATVDELKGTVPHCISVNELDPLRDEGLEHYQKLKRAGVSCYARVVAGTVHAGDCIWGPQLPEVADATLGDIKRFADGL